MEPRTAATILIRGRLVAIHETDDSLTIAVYNGCDTNTPIDSMEVGWAWDDSCDDNPESTSNEEVQSESDRDIIMDQMEATAAHMERFDREVLGGFWAAKG